MDELNCSELEVDYIYLSGCGGIRKEDQENVVKNINKNIDKSSVISVGRELPIAFIESGPIQYKELQCGQPCNCSANSVKGVVKKHNSKLKIKVAKCYEEIHTGEMCERCKINNEAFELLI